MSASLIQFIKLSLKGSGNAIILKNIWNKMYVWKYFVYFMYT